MYLEQWGCQVDASSIIGLVVVLIACVAFAALYEEPTIKGTASTIDELPALNSLAQWQIRSRARKVIQASHLPF